jgi:hypothetical protein
MYCLEKQCCCEQSTNKIRIEFIGLLVTRVFVSRSIFCFPLFRSFCTILSHLNCSFFSTSLGVLVSVIFSLSFFLHSFSVPLLASLFFTFLPLFCFISFLYQISSRLALLHIREATASAVQPAHWLKYFVINLF